MRSRVTTGLTALGTLAASCVAVVGLAPAASAEEERGRGAVRQADAAARSTARAAEVAPEAVDFDGGLEMPTSYPFEPRLRIYPDNTPDASDSGELLGHDDLAPMLMDLMETSNRLSVQVVGQSSQGRDLYLATVTAPESEAETAAQSAWREEIRTDPVAAAADEELAAGYKTPLWISNNIHGNEWEGTDAAMSTIDDLVSAPWSEVRGLLREHRLYFSLSLNPDGRTLGTRATALSLDPNRDMITNTTPETRSYIRTAHAVQALYAADFHGYTRVLQVEPCGPPHGENYEYDLFIPQAYAMARAVEDDVVAADIPGNTYYDRTTGQAVPVNTGNIKIPYRDTPSGWDDYPPIFTAQYAAFFGAATSTVELPLARPSSTTQSPDSARINTAVAEQTMRSMIDYFDTAADDMLGNQIESFRRGVAGEPKDSLTADEVADVPGPTEWQALWDVADDQDPVTLPRAYVIPAGATQRSASDARRLVEQLLLHEIEVGTLDAETTVDGTTYPAGSYVVDMHQPLRGLANSLLDLGSDISAKVPTMYDISAWSYSYLWGADVDKVGLTTDAPLGATSPVSEPASNAAVARGRGPLAFDLAGVADYQALNALLELGVPVSLLADGSAVVGAGDLASVRQVSADFDIAVARADAEQRAALDDEGTRGVEDLTVAYTGTQDDKLSLTELGFDDLVPVTAAAVEADPSLVTATDLLWIGSSMNLVPGGEARTAVQDWVDEGHGIVGRTRSALDVASSFGLLQATATSGPSTSNGIVAVETPQGSPLAPFAQEASFVYPATWFTGLGEGTTAAQTYSGSPLLAGHWRNTAGTNGPENAAGTASVIAGEVASGARSVVFGTSVFFRTHTKGGLSQAARAMFWAAPVSEGVSPTEPSRTRLRLERLRGQRFAATITVTSPAATPATGRVRLLDDGEVLRTRRLSEGTAVVKVVLERGRHELVATYAGSAGLEPSQSRTRTVRVR